MLSWRSAEEHKSPDVMAINPRGQLPAFKDGDVIVNESFAAIIYLEETYDSGAQLLPKDTAKRALVSTLCLNSAQIEQVDLGMGLTPHILPLQDGSSHGCPWSAPLKVAKVDRVRGRAKASIPRT